MAAEEEASAPRPRKRIGGCEGGGGGPIIESRGSESEPGEGERSRLVAEPLRVSAEGFIDSFECDCSLLSWFFSNTEETDRRRRDRW